MQLGSNLVHTQTVVLGVVIAMTEGDGEAVTTDKPVLTHYAVYFEDRRFLLDTSLADVCKSILTCTIPTDPISQIPARVDADAQMITG